MIRDVFQYLGNLQTVGGVTGTIALVITFTLCIGYLRAPAANPGEVGKSLILALTAIIGFSFRNGSGSKKAPAPVPPAAISQPPSN